MSDRIVTTIVRADWPHILFVDEDDGSLYFGAMMRGGIYKHTLDGTITLFASGFMRPQSMVRGPDGALYVADYSYIRVIRDGQVSILAGHDTRESEEYEPVDGVGADAVVVDADTIWFDNDRLMFWDQDTLRSVSMDGAVTTIATHSDASTRSIWNDAIDLHSPGQAIDKDGNKYYHKAYEVPPNTAFVKALPDGTEQITMGVKKYTPVTDGPIETATFDESYTFGSDRVRNILYLADRRSIRKIGPNSIDVKKSDLEPVDIFTGDEFKQGDSVIRIGGKNNWIYNREELEKWWEDHPNTNPLVSGDQEMNEDTTIEYGTLNILPGGGRRRRQTKKANRKKKMTRKRRVDKK
jgi:hypothetical protein